MSAATTEILRDGRTVTVRPIVPGDADLLVEFHGRLSPRTRELRFHGPKPRLLPREARYLARPDPVHRVALVATVVEEGAERIVADGRIEKEDDGGDVALVVRDDHQGAGLGRILLDRLLEAAPRLGLERLSFLILPQNRPMLRLAERAGAAPVGRDGAADLLVAVPSARQKLSQAPRSGDGQPSGGRVRG
jgi:GNAT superfamily N-acetyltransferase